jgi:D-alanyl-D-alanine carboxypeptidase
MGQPSQPASNGIIYTTYAVFLIFGLAVAWTLRHQTKGEYLASLRTQKGIPLAFNFIASGECARKAVIA